jgi:type II secretory pathway predicted ATPase ExeA
MNTINAIATTDLTAEDTMSSLAKRRADRVALQVRLEGMFIKTARVDGLLDEMNNLFDWMAASLLNEAPEGRILAVVGEPGAGKTWGIQHCLKKALPSHDILMSTIAPAPCTSKQLGRSLLTGLGYPLLRDMPEHVTWEMVRAQLKAAKKRLLWIDEMHHVLTTASRTELVKISETLKNIVQQSDWPVSLILSGRPVLSSFIGRDFQIERRSNTVHFEPLSFQRDGENIRSLIKAIIEKQAGMSAGKLVTDTFVHKVCIASESGLGNIIQLVRMAIYRAFDRAGAEATITAEDFAKVYRGQRGCEDSQNIFLARNWHEIVPQNSRLRDVHGAQDVEDAVPVTTAKKKGAK